MPAPGADPLGAAGAGEAGAPAADTTPPRPVSASRTGLRAVARYLLLAVVSFVVLFPIYMTVVTSLLTPPQIARRPPLLYPPNPQWGNFVTGFNAGHLGEYLRNSAIVSICITVAVVTTSVLAAYAFAFIRFPLKRVLFALCLASLMVPAEVTIIPNYRTVAAFGWLNTFPALIVPFMASGVGIFLFRQAFRGLPTELRDAATLDGLGHFKFLIRVVLPLSRPVLGAFGVFAFLGAWNQYLWPLIVTRTDSVRTVQIGLNQLVGSSFTDIGVRAAGTVLAALPIFIVLLIFQRSLVRGLTTGAVKG
ncbi:MAG TPA: carbohydrate ABC transporter permease [Acidimicrobiales bacterium]|nr:carbohydrate ABC transporter permease [Acidimicrobiales bacterium]